MRRTSRFRALDSDAARNPDELSPEQVYAMASKCLQGNTREIPPDDTTEYIAANLAQLGYDLALNSARLYANTSQGRPIRRWEFSIGFEIFQARF